MHEDSNDMGDASPPVTKGNAALRRVLIGAVALGTAAGAAAGASALASAATSPDSSGSGSSTSSAQAPSTQGPGPFMFRGAGPGGFGGGFDRMGPVLHGEYTIAVPAGGYETLVEQNGTVSSITQGSGSDYSLIVNSADGKSVTYTVDSGTSVDGGETGVSSISKGDTVQVTALANHGAYQAKQIEDQTVLKANASTWMPAAPAPPSSGTGTSSAASSSESTSSSSATA